MTLDESQRAFVRYLQGERRASVRTVEAHKYTMMQILGVHSTIELVRRAEELGLLF